MIKVDPVNVSNLFSHIPFSEYLLIIYYVPVNIPGTGDKMVSKNRLEPWLETENK